MKWEKKMFGQRLKMARQQQGLTQGQLGIAIGLDEDVAAIRINRYEKGVHSVNFTLLGVLADVLNVPVAFFFTYPSEAA